MWQNIAYGRPEAPRREIIRAEEFQREMSTAEFHYLCGKYVAERERVLGLQNQSLLAAAYRNRLHWSQLVGGDVVLSLTHQWQARFNASKVEVHPRVDDPVDPAILSELSDLVPDFRRAYEPDGMRPDEFDAYGATVRTLRQFIGAYRDLQATIRDFILPNPDKKV